jgi:NTE family protein
VYPELCTPALWSSRAALLLVISLLGCATTPGVTKSSAVREETTFAAQPTPEVPTTPEVAPPAPEVGRPPLPVVIPPPRIALVLGGGAAKGFAHIGVIKALESQGVQLDIIVGTSAGSVVGALYAGGYDGFALQRIAMDMKESTLSDWSLPDRGIWKGEALQSFIDKAVQNRPLEQLNRRIGVVATDLQSGEPIVFERGDTGIAVRASSSVPGVFQPVRISGRDYVDGGLVSPVPVRAARNLGADIVIAVDISTRPASQKVDGTIDVLLQTFAIMGNALAASELPQADVVVKPDISKLSSTDFQSRHLAILEGERAGLAAMPELRRKLAAREERLRAALAPQPASAASK